MWASVADHVLPSPTGGAEMSETREMLPLLVGEHGGYEEDEFPAFASKMAAILSPVLHHRLPQEALPSPARDGATACPPASSRTRMAAEPASKPPDVERNDALGGAHTYAYRGAVAAYTVSIPWVSFRLVTNVILTISQPGASPTTPHHPRCREQIRALEDLVAIRSGLIWPGT